jgi:anthranilate synthase/aminodeoxychorismate synthase-like glutamine amidotransferase
MSHILFIDNYDSFTYNIVHYVLELGAQVEVVRNDAIRLEDIAHKKPDGIILSPGPCTPNEAGICLQTVETYGATIPMLGVCLGHQAIAQAHGGNVVRAAQVMHGKTSPISHNATGVFAGLPSPYTATRYHSLIVERESLPTCFDITAETEDGIIMGLAHKEKPLHGVQFHPESIASEHGHALLKNFLALL